MRERDIGPYRSEDVIVARPSPDWYDLKWDWGDAQYLDSTDYLKALGGLTMIYESLMVLAGVCLTAAAIKEWGREGAVVGLFACVLLLHAWDSYQRHLAMVLEKKAGAGNNLSDFGSGGGGNE